MASRLASLGRGQIISILIAGTGIFASLLADRNLNYPTLLSGLNYALLALVYFPRRFRCQDRERVESESQTSLWIYVLAGLMDVEANFLVIMAYNYTTITSVMLLDCFTIPTSMLFSFLFLSCKYSYWHILGAFVCICGLTCIVIGDSLLNDAPEQAKNALIGDVCCLCGSFLYAATNVLQEKMVKFHERTEYLGCMGSFASLFVFFQFWFVDYPNFQSSVFSNVENLGYTCGFVFCLFMMYSQTSLFLVEGDATLFNLSLLTSDVYAVLFAYCMYGQSLSVLYLVAFILVGSGLFIYHREKPPISFGSSEESASLRQFDSLDNGSHHDDAIDDDDGSDTRDEEKGKIESKKSNRNEKNMLKGRDKLSTSIVGYEPVTYELDTDPNSSDISTTTYNIMSC